MTKRIITTAKDLINKQTITDEKVMTKRIITTAKYLIHKQTITDEKVMTKRIITTAEDLHPQTEHNGRKSHD